jgi:hypothetical protein
LIILPWHPTRAIDRAVYHNDTRCRSNQIAPVGHVMAAHGVIKAEQRCAVCGTAFFVVRPAFT